jgi:hypothetical protein
MITTKHSLFLSKLATIFLILTFVNASFKVSAGLPKIIVLNDSATSGTLTNVLKSNSISANIATFVPNQNYSSTPDPIGFVAGNVITDDTLYYLPSQFDSSSKIQSYLQSSGSFLANYQVEMSFENDDDIYVATPYLRQLQGKKVLFSEFVWQLARTQLGDGCSLYNSNICTNISQRPINPGVLLAIIQRESGLIYGQNAKSDPNSQNTRELLDRATGFLCNEGGDKTKSCWDENPDWKYYKGIFRQVYYMNRNLMLNTKRCQSGNGINLYGQIYNQSSVVRIDGQDLQLQNGFSCALYIYSPHFSSQKSLFNVTKNMNAFHPNQLNFINNSNAKPINNSKAYQNSEPKQFKKTNLKINIL